MNRIAAIAVVALGLALAGCGDSPVAYGTPTDVIVVAPEPLWTEIEDTLSAALESPVFTVRDETTFELTHIPPDSPEWATLREWKQVLVIGPPEAEKVRAVLEEADGPVPDPPAIATAEGLWARGQSVTALVVPPGGGAEAVVPLLDELDELYETRFREYVLRRMYVSGRDVALRDTLLRRAGFALLLPEVYDRSVEDSVYIFRNDYTRGDLQVHRHIAVTWRSGVPDTLTADFVLDWRERINERYLEFPQVTTRERLRVRRLEEAGARAIEVRGIWENPPGEFPTAGLFISRVVVCPEQDRTYFLDAFLYAPGEEQYEYIIQLSTILNTFACGDVRR